MDFAQAVKAALDPVLVPVGFAPGQCGGTQGIYCAGHDELSDRFPALPQADDQSRGGGACIDLVLHRVDPGVEVDLEGQDLADTLRALALHEEAATVERLARAPLDAALAELATILPRLLHAAEATTPPR